MTVNFGQGSGSQNRYGQAVKAQFGRSKFLTAVADVSTGPIGVTTPCPSSVSGSPQSQHPTPPLSCPSKSPQRVSPCQSESNSLPRKPHTRRPPFLLPTPPVPLSNPLTSTRPAVFSHASRLFVSTSINYSNSFSPLKFLPSSLSKLC